MLDSQGYISKRHGAVFLVVIFQLLLVYLMMGGHSMKDSAMHYSKASRPEIASFNSLNKSNNYLLERVQEALRTGGQSSSQLFKQLKDVLGLALANRWHTLPDKFQRLQENIVYKQFDIHPPAQKEKVDLIFIVSSAPKRLERRQAIRETWWPDCKPTERLNIKCIFLTDKPDPATEQGKALIEESEKFKDLKFQKLEGGTDFGKRFLYHMFWAMTFYDFNYFLRLDDDYFICMDRFVQEVPMPPKTFYHWGWVHCVNGMVRPEESIILLSRDIIETFLGQDPTQILCHKWADQMIGIWNEQLHLKKFYRHDGRLHHDPPSAFVERFKTEQNICQNYIGVHGSYPLQMRTLWEHRGPSQYPANKSFDDYSGFCQYPSVMSWKDFGGEWHGEPQPCKDNPVWSGPRGDTYKGRQGHK